MPHRRPLVLTSHRSGVAALLGRLERLSVRVQLALVFGLLSVLVGFPAYIYISGIHQEQLLRDRHAVLNSLALTAASALSESLEDRSRDISILAQLPILRREALDSRDARAALDLLKRSSRNYSWIGIADTHGQVQSATNGFLVGQSVAHRPWFSAGVGGDHIGDVHEALLLEQLLQPDANTERLRFIDFAAPIQGEDGRTRGVLGAHVHWRWAADLLRTITPPTAESHKLEILIVDARQAVIYPDTRVRLAAPPQHTILAQPLEFHDWGDGHRYLTAAASVQTPASSSGLEWKVYVRTAEEVVLADVGVLQRAALATAVFASLLFWLLGWLLADGVSQPVQRLTVAARRIGRGETGVEFDTVGSAREVRELSTALGDMASALLTHRRALEDANHDLEAKVAQRTEELHQLAERMAQQARTDALTGLPNRLSATERLSLEFDRMQRSERNYCVLMLDIDHFKRVNDQYGHPVGDRVLQAVAPAVMRAIRSSDFGARMGGEEFLVLLPMTRLDEAVEVAEKIRASVASTVVAPVGTVSVSVGVAQAELVDETLDEALVRADEALYRAKESGRNRVAAEPQRATERRTAQGGVTADS